MVLHQVVWLMARRRVWRTIRRRLGRPEKRQKNLSDLSHLLRDSQSFLCIHHELLVQLPNHSVNTKLVADNTQFRLYCHIYPLWGKIIAADGFSQRGSDDTREWPLLYFYSTWTKCHQTVQVWLRVPYHCDHHRGHSDFFPCEEFVGCYQNSNFPYAKIWLAVL